MDHLKKAATRSVSSVGATEFKARCLQLMQEVHDRKRNSLTITKRGKPYVKVVPAPAGPRALYGCLEGLAEAKGDLTQPVDVKWEAARD